MFGESRSDSVLCPSKVNTNEQFCNFSIIASWTPMKLFISRVDNLSDRDVTLTGQLRYKFRLYPTPGQQLALARAFGCARGLQ
ncbi:helix-turn-helix domain-containing protein [Rhodococcus opacus]|uniref:helix-turn-helix domain-containing protein n=1 Tax=Rhodococcus opacus TaxID=37919 RepID=UPI003CD03B90